MAPVEADAAARNNIFAYAPFGSHVALVVGLTAHVLLVARRAAKALPPTTSTRTQQPLRRQNAIVFSALAAASLASVTTFAVLWRAVSYINWAHSGSPNAPNALHLGSYGTGADGRFYFGDWIRDIDLQKESDRVAIAHSEGFLYTFQHFVGLLVSSIFFGVEGERAWYLRLSFSMLIVVLPGHRRNLSPATIASFVVLGATGSLGYALSLFFVTILYTPLTIHNEDSPLHDALFTPSPVVYYLPVALSMVFLYLLPGKYLPSNLDTSTISFLRSSKVVVPLLLAFAPQVSGYDDILVCLLINADCALEPWTTACHQNGRSSILRKGLPIPFSCLGRVLLDDLPRQHLQQYPSKASPYLQWVPKTRWSVETRFVVRQSAVWIEFDWAEFETHIL